MLAFSDTNMLVSPTQNSGVGGLSQRQGPTQPSCVAVEYRLKSQHVCDTPGEKLCSVFIYISGNKPLVNIIKKIQKDLRVSFNRFLEVPLNRQD